MRRPKPPKKRVEELRDEVIVLLKEEFHHPSDALRFVLAMLNGWDLEALISQLHVKSAHRKDGP